MRISEYKKISENVQIPEVVMNGYQKAIEQIKAEKEQRTLNNRENMSSKKVRVFGKRLALPKVAVILLALLFMSGGTVLSVRAYIRHMDKLKNIENEKIINLYENVFQYDSRNMSRGMSESEERRYGELLDLYCTDMAEPKGEVRVIASNREYTGKEVAFSIEDGIVYLPETEMDDEQMLQLVEFHMLGHFVNYEAYVKATNPLYFLNRLEKMTMYEVDKIYRDYYSANTETSFFSRDLSFSEMARRKILKDLYKKGFRVPEQNLKMIDDVKNYSQGNIAFCRNTCTFILPSDEMTDEQLLEMIDFQVKVDYCKQRIAEEINGGVRKDWPELRTVKRERIITINPDMKADEELLSREWLKAYEEVLKQYYKMNEALYDDPERYYANVCFIYLNNDEIPEMLLSYGCTDMDYDDRCNTRTYLYTYKDGKAVLLSPGEDTLDDFYGYTKAFCYAERKGMVYCDYYYPYSFSTYDNQTGRINQIQDNMSRLDIWDFETLTRISSKANIKMLHAVYDYEHEEYADADFRYEYYTNVSEIIRNAETGEVATIVGESVNREAYEAAENALWEGEKITILQTSDFDKIYCDDDIAEMLARCFMKQM